VSALPDSGQQATDLVKSVLENRSSVPPPPGETSADSPAKQSAAREASDSSISAVKRAAAQGRPESQLELAVRYANGDGVPQSYAEALHWFSKAEANGVLPREPAAVDAKERTEAWVLEHMQAPH
jgi:TPR repeat protein